MISSCKINPSFHSDHASVEMNIETFSSNVRGKGVWKFNNTLLKDINYVQIINDVIEKN